MAKMCKNCSWLMEVYLSYMPGGKTHTHSYCNWFKNWGNGAAVRLFDDEMNPSPLWCPLKEEE